MKTDSKVIAPSNSDVYYNGSYWNDFPYVQEQINIRTSGRSDLTWYDDFFKKNKKPFKKVLILNCGNGWVERKLYKKGYFEKVVGVDFSSTLLKEARNKSKGLPFRYYKLDINTAKFEEKDFDLVINHAAVHHIARLDKVFRSILKVMTPNGIFVNYDYVGAHRNQYPLLDWETAFKLNETLPANCRQNMSYPHLPTMLATDPSEAIHAELTMPIMQRYFETLFYKPVGGAIAYLLLTHNENILKAPKVTVNKVLENIMKADSDYLKKYPASSMFGYWAVKPNKEVLKDTKLLTQYTLEEIKRESMAEKNNGHYYPLTFVQQLYLELDDLRIAKQHKQSYIEELQQKIDHYEARLSASTKQKVKEIIRQSARKAKQRLKK